MFVFNQLQRHKHYNVKTSEYWKGNFQTTIFIINPDNIMIASTSAKLNVTSAFYHCLESILNLYLKLYRQEGNIRDVRYSDWMEEQVTRPTSKSLHVGHWSELWSPHLDLPRIARQEAQRQLHLSWVHWTIYPLTVQKDHRDGQLQTKSHRSESRTQLFRSWKSTR